MFCPNCGKDCGENRFCRNCGCNLQKIREQNNQNSSLESCSPKNSQQNETIRNLRCPRCLSPEIKTRQAPRRPLVYTGLYGPPALKFVTGSLRLMSVISNARNINRVYHMCMVCGHRWRE